MKKLITVLAILSIVGVTSVWAQRVSQYSCTANSTSQQCQDAVNIDQLQIQLQSAQGAVQAIQTQIQGLGANLQAQLQQAQQSMQNIQSQIQSNEQDYDSQELQARLTTDTASLSSMQAVKTTGVGNVTTSYTAN
jgi:chromosome segregation ATPase